MNEHTDAICLVKGYKLLELVGEGTYGAVYKAETIETK